MAGPGLPMKSRGASPKTLEIKARNLSAGYAGRGLVFASLNLRLRAGEAVSLLGANGAGKSTLIRALAGLIKARAGTVTLDGHDLASLGRRALARRVALVPQGEVPVFAFSVEELVRMGRYPHVSFWKGLRPADHEAVESALREADLLKLRARPLDALSGGERQRTVLARALAQSASFLLLDEPSSHLDLRHTEALVRLLRRLRKRGLGILMATHDLDFARRTTDRAILMRGRRRALSLGRRQMNRKTLLRLGR